MGVVLAISFMPKENFPLSVPVKTPVNQDYDAMDRTAIKRGYSGVYSSGWIATMGVSSHDPKRMLEEFNRKGEAATREGIPWIAGFCQTGHFSVGYTIYVKPPYGESLVK